MENANKAESARCVEIAQKYLINGDKAKAVKFLRKALSLCSDNRNARDLLDRLERLENDDANDADDGGDGYSAYEQYDDGTSPRHRFRDGSKSRRGGGGGDESMSNGGPANEDSASSGGGSSKRHKSAERRAAHEYTEEQLVAVRRVLKSKDYYEILNVTKTFTDSELKKAYRKLALQLHPDKCNAPGTAEAFKAIGNAYSILNDAEKRKRYDAFGAEGPSVARRSSHYHEYDRGFDSEFTPEEIFNMFFGGGFPSGATYRYTRRGNTFYYHHGGGQHQYEEDDRQQSGLGVLVQLLPFILLVVLSLVSTLLVGDPAYSLHRTDKYHVPRQTGDLAVTYYVKADFLQKYTGNVYRLEKQVEEDYLDQLRNNCYRERLQKEHRLWQARTYGDAATYERVQRQGTPSCDRLQQIYA